jgi:hypothetical protein
MSDFYQYSAQRRMQMLGVERQSALADLATYQANGDADSAASTIQQIADIDAQARNLGALHQQYVASQTPQYDTASQEERDARPWDRMTWDDVVQMTRGSKYGKNIRHDDPWMVAGYYEAQRRRGRGE